LVDPAASSHAVLSQDPPEHRQNLLPADQTILNQTHHPLHMFDDWFGTRQWIGGWRRWDRQAAFGVLNGLLDFAFGLPVIGHTPLGGTLLAMSFLAAERTPQIFPPGVARITEKEDPAMPASSQASSQVRAGFYNRSQQQVLLKHQTRHRMIPIPAAGKVKMLCDLYCKKPKLPLRMLTLLKTTPSYRICPQGSRKQDGDFLAQLSLERKTIASSTQPMAQFI
jgi:hypothetical protein